MIKKYKQFNEGVLQHLIGPSEEEILKEIEKLPLIEYVFKCDKIGYEEGVIKSLPKLMNNYLNGKYKNFSFGKEFIKLAMKYEKLYDYIGFILLLCEESSYILELDILTNAFHYNNLEYLKYILDEKIYPRQNQNMFDKDLANLLERQVEHYNRNLSKELKDYVKNYIHEKLNI